MKTKIRSMAESLLGTLLALHKSLAEENHPDAKLIAQRIVTKVVHPIEDRKIKVHTLIILYYYCTRIPVKSIFPKKMAEEIKQTLGFYAGNKAWDTDKMQVPIEDENLLEQIRILYNNATGNDKHVRNPLV